MFLKAIALGLSAPIAMKMARFATAQSEGAPKRFFLFYMPHGIAPEHYNPRVAEGDWKNFALDQTNESILAPLETTVDPFCSTTSRGRAVAAAARGRTRPSSHRR